MLLPKMSTIWCKYLTSKLIMFTLSNVKMDLFQVTFSAAIDSHYKSMNQGWIVIAWPISIFVNMQCTFKLLPLKTETRLIQTIQMRYKTRYQIYCKRNPLKLLFGIYRGVIFVQALILVLQHIAYVIYKSIIYLLTVSCITIKTGNFVHIYYFRHWAQKLGPLFWRRQSCC